MARVFVTPIDLSGLEIQNVLAQKLSSDPSSAEAKFYYNTTDKVVKFYNGTAWISLGRLDQISAPTASVSLNNQRITNVATPVGDNDATNKAYVDNAVTGLDFKESVRATTTANITLSGTQTVDGVALIVGDRVLVKDQTTASSNGIYTVNSGAWSRAADADSTDELNPGSFVFVEEGTIGGDSGWVMTADNPFTLGTTSQTWVQFSGAGQIVAGAGLTKTGNTIDIVAADGSITVNADSIEVGLVPVTKGGTGATTAPAARTALSVPGKYAASVGDNSATSFNVDHNLNSLDAVVTVYRNSDGAEIEADITRSTVNRVIVSFANAPTTNQYKVVVLA